LVPVGVTGGGVVPPDGAPNTWSSATCAPGAPEFEVKESCTSLALPATGMVTVLAFAAGSKV
jgi:hypothetical protein